MARTVGVVFGLSVLFTSFRQFHFWFFAPEETVKASYDQIAWRTEVPKCTTDFHTRKTSHWSEFLSWEVDTVKIYHTGFDKWAHGALWNAIKMNGNASNPLRNKGLWEGLSSRPPQPELKLKLKRPQILPQFRWNPVLPTTFVIYLMGKC